MNLRPATFADCAELAILDDIAGFGLPTVLWNEAVDSGRAENAWEYAREQYFDNGQGSSWKDASIVEIDGEVAGSAIGYHLPPDTNFDGANNPVLRPILVLFKKAIGAWLIDTLAVYRLWRGQGVGQMLLSDQIARAGDKNVYLVAADDNIGALRLYRKNDFREIAQETCVPFSSKNTTKNWLLMRRNYDERG